MCRRKLEQERTEASETIAKLHAENLALSADLLIWKEIASNRYQQIQRLRGELLAERTE